jgi:hypothetical protein
MPERPPHAPQPAQVGGDRRAELDTRVEIFDPVDRDRVAAHAVALGEEQQLRVKEPP